MTGIELFHQDKVPTLYKIGSLNVLSMRRLASVVLIIIRHQCLLPITNLLFSLSFHRVLTGEIKLFTSNISIFTALIHVPHYIT